MEDFSDLTSTVPKIEFPSGLKVRHPLFGIGKYFVPNYLHIRCSIMQVFVKDYEKRVGLAAPKKKRSKSKVFEEDAVKKEISSSSEGETPKKKKSRKEVTDIEMIDISKRIKMEAFSSNSSDSDARQTKKKKRKM